MLEFIIPVKRDNLLVSKSTSHYCVCNRIPLNMIPSKITEALYAFKLDGAAAVLSHFDSIFSLLINFSKCGTQCKDDAWQAVLYGITDVKKMLLSDFDDSDSLRNMLKMNIYLLNQLLVMFENSDTSTENLSIKAPKKRGRANKAANNENQVPECWNWVNERNIALQAINSLLELNIAPLWKESEIEPDFIELIGKTCFKTLENPLISKVTSASCREYIGRILGILIQKHSFALSCSLNVIQLLSNHEHLTSSLAEISANIVNTYNGRHYLSEIVCDIGKMDPKELARDTGGTKSIATFLHEVTIKCPAAMLSLFSVIMDHLEEESIAMRMSLLSMIGEMLLQELSNEDLSESLMLTRNEFFEDVLLHVHDVNAHVRNRDIGVLCSLAQKRAIPTEFQKAAIVRVVGALQDVSSLVRKSALQYVSIFIATTTFNIKEQCAFTKIVNNVVLPYVTSLLSSQTVTDVMGSIELLVTASLAGFYEATRGVHSMLYLLQNKNQNIRKAIVDAYIQLFFTTTEPSKTAIVISTAQNLVSLLQGADESMMICYESLISELVLSEHLDDEVLSVLWEMFMMKRTDTTEADSIVALIVLTMAASVNVNIIRSNISVILKFGLGERADKDFLLAKYSLQALLKLQSINEDKSCPRFRFQVNSEIVSIIERLVLQGFSTPCAHWSAMADAAFKLLYQLVEQPDVPAAEILLKLYDMVLNEAGKTRESISTLALCRLLSVLGELAIRIFIHIDVNILNECKRRNLLKEDLKEKKLQEKNKRRNRRSKNTSLASIGMNSTFDSTKFDDTSISDTTMNSTSKNVDALTDTINGVLNNEIVTGEGLLAKFAPFVINIVRKGDLFSERIRGEAAITLAKFMLVSSKFCEDNLLLLFKVFEKDEDEIIRSNLIILISDLALRFPNLLVPWTPQLYSRLRDDSLQVRKNTITSIMRLVLNEMVKVKGHISEVALCIVDNESEISQIAKLLFSELSKKGNALYNVLPDMISRLSDSETGADESSFQTIISYIFSLLTKDKINETLVEKLCSRFATSQHGRQCRDIVYCLSQLTYNEKSISALQISLPSYAAKLSEQEVYDGITNILESAKKNVKPEFKCVIEEFAEKIQRIHETGASEEETVNAAIVSSQNTQGKTIFKEPQLVPEEPREQPKRTSKRISARMATTPVSKSPRL